MPVNETDIVVNKCFATNTGQVRRVLSVADGAVNYEARGKKSLPKDTAWPNKQTAKIETFAADVDAEVAWDYDPNYAA